MDVTAPHGVRTGVCVIRAEADGPTGLRITVTARVDVEDELGERSSVTTNVATAVGRIREFLEAFVRQG